MKIPTSPAHTTTSPGKTRIGGAQEVGGRERSFVTSLYGQHSASRGDAEGAGGLFGIVRRDAENAGWHAEGIDDRKTDFVHESTLGDSKHCGNVPFDVL